MFDFGKKLFVGIDPGMNGGVAFIKPELDNDYIKGLFDDLLTIENENIKYTL